MSHELEDAERPWSGSRAIDELEPKIATHDDQRLVSSVRPSHASMVHTVAYRESLTEIWDVVPKLYIELKDTLRPLSSSPIH